MTMTALAIHGSNSPWTGKTLYSPQSLLVLYNGGIGSRWRSLRDLRWISHYFGHLFSFGDCGVSGEKEQGSNLPNLHIFTPGQVETILKMVDQHDRGEVVGGRPYGERAQNFAVVLLRVDGFLWVARVVRTQAPWIVATIAGTALYQTGALAEIVKAIISGAP